jgi:hypothetical protein
MRYVVGKGSTGESPLRRRRTTLFAFCGFVVNLPPPAANNSVCFPWTCRQSSPSKLLCLLIFMKIAIKSRHAKLLLKSVARIKVSATRLHTYIILDLLAIQTVTSHLLSNSLGQLRGI